MRHGGRVSARHGFRSPPATATAVANGSAVAASRGPPATSLPVAAAPVSPADELKPALALRRHREISGLAHGRRLRLECPRSKHQCGCSAEQSQSMGRLHIAFSPLVFTSGRLAFRERMRRTQRRHRCHHRHDPEVRLTPER